MERPKKLYERAIILTPEAKAANIQGLAIVKCVINLDGTLSNCRIIKGLQFLDKAILEAVSAWKYTPVTFQGRPVSVDYVINLKVTQ
jgi:protein TonB